MGMDERWFRIEHKGKGVFDVKILWWHPSFWFEAYKAIRLNGGTSRLMSLYLAFLLVWRFAVK